MAPVIYKRQSQILDFIKQYIQANASAPTLRQIADAIGVSSLATVHEHLATLERKGLIKRITGKTRSIEEQIRDGDYVVIEQTEEAKNGDIVVALLDNGMATLKRFFREATRIRLEPANSRMNPLFVKNVRVQGKVVGLIRRYAAN